MKPYDQLCQCNIILFPLFIRLQVCFLSIGDADVSWLLLKTIYSVFMFFSMSTLFRCSTRFSAVVVFWRLMMAPVLHLLIGSPARCWKCIFGLGILEWNWFSLRCIQVLNLVLKCCSDMNEGNWKHSSFLFFFHYVGEHKRMTTKNEFFSLWGQVLGRIFFVLHFFVIACVLISIFVWTGKDWFCNFLLKLASFCHCRICMD